MASGRLPEGPAALSNAERQARHRAKMLALGPLFPPNTPRRRRGEALERRVGRVARGPGRMRRVVQGPA